MSTNASDNPDAERLGRIAWEAKLKTMEAQGWDYGITWDDQPQSVQKGWVAAAQAVADAVNQGPGEATKRSELAAKTDMDAVPRILNYYSHRNASDWRNEFDKIGNGCWVSSEAAHAKLTMLEAGCVAKWYTTAEPEEFAWLGPMTKRLMELLRDDARALRSAMWVDLESGDTAISCEHSVLIREALRECGMEEQG